MKSSFIEIHIATDIFAFLNILKIEKVLVNNLENMSGPIMFMNTTD